MREPAAPELSPPAGTVAASPAEAPLIAATGLCKRFPIGSGRRAPVLHAVDAVDLALRRGESVGLVGESGCGKSTLSRLLARLLDPSEGTISFEGRDIGAIPARAFATSGTRGKIQLVFQDATDSLDPRQTARQAIAEPLQRLGIAGDAVQPLLQPLLPGQQLPQQQLSTAAALNL